MNWFIGSLKIGLPVTLVLGLTIEMNLRLNAKQKQEIETLLKKADIDPGMFKYTTRQSECVSVFVRHAYRALDGYEPTTAEAICLRANPDYFFTFERDEHAIFFASCYPELDVGPNIEANGWDDLLNAFRTWIETLKVQIEADNVGPTKSPIFVDMLRDRDLGQIKNEFRRAEQDCISDPPAAVAAASSMVESACKLYMADHGLSLPSKPTVKALWSVVLKDLLPDPAFIVDDDVKRLISGLSSVVDGLGALRTHASSAHGRDRSEPEIGVGEALLAIHASQSLVLFLLNKWK